MTNPSHTFKDQFKDFEYPFHYSARIVEKFVEKYARATIFCAKKLGISPREFKWSLIVLFAKSNNRWNSVRDAIKYVEKNNMYNYLSKYDADMLAKYLTFVRYICEDSLLEVGFSNGRY